MSLWDTVKDYADKTIEFGTLGLVDDASQQIEDVYDSLSGKDIKESGQDALNIANANVERIQMETDEEVRRLKLAQNSVLATTRARAAASGVKLEGSVSTYLDTMQENFGKQLDWIQKSSASREEITRMTGEYQKKQTEAQGEAQGWGTLMQIGSWLA